MSSTLRKSLIAFFKTDRASFLICIVIALFGWLIIKLNKEYSQSFIFPLAYQVSEDLTFSEIPPGQINTQLRAKGWTLLRLGFRKKDTLTLTLSDFLDQTLASRQSLEQKFNQLNIDQAEFELIYPEELRLKLAQKHSKKVPIRIAGNVSITPQHQLRDAVVITPDSITIYGPKQEIDKVNQWNTISWPFDPLNSDLTTSMQLEASDHSLLQLEQYACEVFIPVEEITEKELIIPIQIVDSLKGKVQIFPDQALLKCTVGLSKFESIRENQFTLIAFPEESQDKWKVILIKQPKESTLINFSPQTVEYFLINP